MAQMIPGPTALYVNNVLIPYRSYMFDSEGCDGLGLLEITVDDPHVLIWSEKDGLVPAERTLSYVDVTAERDGDALRVTGRSITDPRK